VPLLAHWGLALAPRLFGDDVAKALAASAAWTITPFLLLALALGWVATRARRAASQQGN
jgi:preprotein translocase subunit SecG